MRGTWLLASLWFMSIALAVAGVWLTLSLGPALIAAAPLAAVWSYLVVDVTPRAAAATSPRSAPAPIVDEVPAAPALLPSLESIDGEAA